MRPAFFFISLALAGCGGAPYEPPSSPSSPSLSAYSTSAGSSFAPSSPAVPQGAATRGDLIVRPDLLVFGFAIRETGADAQKALAAAEAAVSALRRRLDQVTSGTAAVRMCGTTITPVHRGKAADSAPAEAAVAVDGVVEVSLPAALDYWGRSRLLVGIVRVTEEVTAAAKDEKDLMRGATFEQPRATLKDPEAHRAELSARWIRRARAFAEAAQAAAAPLYLVNCAPPGEIEQRAISLEEIGLSLSVTCQLDALPAGLGGGTTR